MAYIIESLKKVNFKFRNKKNKSKKLLEEDKIFIFIVILSAMIISIDYALVIKFMEILENL